MSAHTPGPWTICSDGGEVFVQDAAARWDICTVAPHGTATGDQREANARLIAAAPSLLEACEAALREWESPVPSVEGLGDMLRAAIALARGAR